MEVGRGVECEQVLSLPGQTQGTDPPEQAPCAPTVWEWRPLPWGDFRSPCCAGVVMGAGNVDVFIEKHFPLFLETTSEACPATQAPRCGPWGAVCKTALREPCSWHSPLSGVLVNSAHSASHTSTRKSFFQQHLITLPGNILGKVFYGVVPFGVSPPPPSPPHTHTERED